MAVYSIDEILSTVLGWEKDLTKFLNDLPTHFNDPRVNEIALLLKKNQEKAMHTLGQIDPKDYERIEWDKNLPKLDTLDFTKNLEFNESMNEQELIGKIFDFEEGLLQFYRKLRGFVSYQKAEELFALLEEYKMGQIKHLNSYLEIGS